MGKIDLHLHLTPFQIPKLGKLNLTSGKNMLPHLEALGIDKGVLMSSGEKGLPFGTNEANRRICQQFPESYAWMCNLSPKGKESVFERLAQYKAQGAIGIGELTYNHKLSDPFLQEIFAAAEKLGMPVTIHMSPEEGYSYGVVDDPGLPLLEQVLAKYPGLKILGHSQTFWIEMSADAPKDKEGRNSWGDGPVIPGGRVPELFEKYPNLYGDLSANSGSRAIMRDPQFGLAFLERYADRLFFATDMVNKDMVFPLGAWLDEQVQAGKLSRSAYNRICFENARRVFGL
ncbi:MAG: amidohydrolase family protein [Oscillospiraceae bacterium]|nr:amidohydrolase family protein [Oscillospiraceae bacterium]MBR2890175.1 amidohydrolase family protein [Oscillospiraceae bacterium]